MAKLIIPTKVIMSGNIEAAKTHYGFARLQMHILENAMRFQGLKQGSRVRRCADGSVVECWSCFGLRQINITSPGGRPEHKQQVEICFCNGCVALGIITGVHDITFFDDDPTTTTDDLCYDRVDACAPSQSYYCGNIVYDVDVCNESLFVKFLNVMATDNTPYCFGQQVLVAPYPISSDAEMFIEQVCYSACGEACFAGSPIISAAILPIDASIIPQWIKEQRGRQSNG